MRGDGWENLLEYYSRELTYLRKAGGEFAKRYPKVASRLEIGAGQTDAALAQLKSIPAVQNALAAAEQQFPDAAAMLNQASAVLPEVQQHLDMPNEVDVVPRQDSHGRTWYLVRYGIFPNRAEATAVAMELKLRENLDALVRPSNSM
jgi:hypothetical protein